MSSQKEVFQILVDLADKHGLSPVKDACNQFLKAGLKAINQPVEKRIQVSPALVRKAWIKQGGRCRICEEPVPLDEVAGDHVDPHNLGGKIDERNIVAVHGTKSKVNCNSKKGGRDMQSESKRSNRLFVDMMPVEGDE